MINELLNNNAFLDFAIAICQVVIILIPIFAKKTLINRQPKRLFKKPAYTRVRPGVYFILMLTVIGTCLLIQKEKVSEEKSKADVKSSEDRYDNMLFAIHQNGYVYDASTKKLLDSLHRFKLPAYIMNKTSFDGKPRLSNMTVFPRLVDTINVKKLNVMYLHVVNAGLSRAENVIVKYVLFLDTLDQGHSYRQPQAEYSIIDARTGLELRCSFNMRNLNLKDTLFCATKYTFTDSLRKPQPAVYGYFYYTKNDGLSFSSLSDNASNALKLAAKKFGTF